MGAGILQDLVVVMVIAAAVTILFYRLKQPVVLGYLLAGLVVGPHTLGLIKDTNSIDGLAELGVIFLMFAVGLEFDLRKLRKVGAAAVIAATIEVSIMFFLGFEAGALLGWTPFESAFLGAVLAITSTMIVVKMLTEMGKIKEDYADVIIGISIFEDILGVAIVAVLTALGKSHSLDLTIIPGVVAGVALFMFVFVAVGLVLLPRLIDSVSKFHVEEVLVITVVGLAFAAGLLAEATGFSIAMGAFLMGAIIAESRAVKRVEHKVLPIRDLFTAMFFVAVGMQVDPRLIAEYWQPILIISVLSVVGRIVAVMVGAYVGGYEGRMSLKAALAMTQLGEFSFIIAGLAITVGVNRPELSAIAVGVCAINTLTLPFFIKSGPRITDKIAAAMPRWLTKASDVYSRGARRLLASNADPMKKKDSRAARHGTRMFIYAAWLLGLLIMAAYASEWAGAEVGERLSLGSNAERAAAIGCLGFLTLPLFVAFVKATESYVFAVAKIRAMDPHMLTKKDAKHRRPKFIARAVAIMLSAATILLATRIAWGVHPLAVPNAWLLVPILLAIGLTGFLAWHKLERVYVGMEKTLNELMGDDEDAVADDIRLKRIKDRLPVGMDVEEVLIRPFDRAAWSSMKDLDLRNQTGASIMVIERGESTIHNPPSSYLIMPHDRLMLLGTRDQIQRGMRYLQTVTPRRGDDFVSESVHVPPSSPANGRTLGELGLEEGDARIGHVQRPDGAIFAPHPSIEISADDRLTVHGSPQAISRVREKLGSIRHLSRATRRLVPIRQSSPEDIATKGIHLRGREGSMEHVQEHLKATRFAPRTPPRMGPGG